MFIRTGEHRAVGRQCPEPDLLQRLRGSESTEKPSLLEAVYPGGSNKNESVIYCCMINSPQQWLKKLPIICLQFSEVTNWDGLNWDGFSLFHTGSAGLIRVSGSQKRWLGHLEPLSRKTAQAFSHGSKRDGRPLCSCPFQAFACVMFTNVLLAKAKPRVMWERLHKSMDMGSCLLLGLINTTIYQRKYDFLIERTGKLPGIQHFRNFP